MLSFNSVLVQAGQKLILDSVSVALGSSEMVGLIGPNGAGKSTLLKAGLGLVASIKAETRVDELSYESLPLLTRGKKVSYLPQSNAVEWQMSSKAVVMLGRYPYRRPFGGQSPECEDAVSKALDAVDAGHLSEQSVHSLSGGERARVMLARALAVEAPYLLADEPVSGLDPNHQLLVMEVLRRQASEGRGVLVVLHDLALASRFMDRLILLDHGKVVAEGSPQSVLTRENLARVYNVEPAVVEKDGKQFLLPWDRLG